MLTPKILIACEESQAVTIELRRLGHEAYSCDIIPCSGGPLTNADRIREMSDKEISVLLSAVKFRRECFIKIPDFLSIQDAYKWLQQVVEEER
mgnify:FL=1